MRMPFQLFLASSGVAVFAVVTPGYGDVFLIALLAVGASLVLLLLAGMRTARQGQRDPRQIIVDGSNVMHWRENTPDIATLRAVIDMLKGLGYRPRVVFDANAGYLVAGGYRHDAAFAQMLGLVQEDVMVVPKGKPADGYILLAARETGAKIVSNDRYRDWEVPHPEIRAPGRLIRGGWRNNGPWADIDAFEPARAAA